VLILMSSSFPHKHYLSLEGLGGGVSWSLKI
jgi:hypothetical protein